MVEVLRATRRISDSKFLQRRARMVVDGLNLVEIDDEILQAAALLQPPVLRSLDAIHLSSALALRPELGGLVAYDSRLIQAAKELEIPVFSPCWPD